MTTVESTNQSNVAQDDNPRCDRIINLLEEILITLNKGVNVVPRPVIDITNRKPAAYVPTPTNGHAFGITPFNRQSEKPTSSETVHVNEVDESDKMIVDTDGLVPDNDGTHKTSSLVDGTNCNSESTGEETHQPEAEKSERAEQQFSAADPTPTPSTPYEKAVA